MRSIVSAGLVAAALSFGATLAHSQEARYLAGNCAHCHGTDGHAVDGSAVPGLAGMPRAYLIAQMNAFRDGTRKVTIMHQHARGYTDEQIAQLAEFFASQKK